MTAKNHLQPFQVAFLEQSRWGKLAPLSNRSKKGGKIGEVIHLIPLRLAMEVPSQLWF